MEKMKQESKVKKPLKIWQGVLTLLVSAIILFVAAPILLSPFGMYGSFARRASSALGWQWGLSLFVSRGICGRCFRLRNLIFRGLQAQF